MIVGFQIFVENSFYFLPDNDITSLVCGMIIHIIKLVLVKVIGCVNVRVNILQAWEKTIGLVKINKFLYKDPNIMIFFSNLKGTRKSCSR